MKKFTLNEDAYKKAAELVNEYRNKNNEVPPLTELQDCDLIMCYGTALNLIDKHGIEMDIEPFIEEFKRRSVAYGRELFVREGLARYEEVGQDG